MTSHGSSGFKRSRRTSVSSESRISCEIDNCRLHRVGARPPAGEAGYPAQGRISSCAPELLGQSSAARQKAACAGGHDGRIWPATSDCVGCCAFAGDRGFLYSELTQSATAEEAAEVRASEYNAYLGGNRTCGIGMNLATGKNYMSFVYLLEELTRPG